jgi:hypothetical protein
VKKPKEPLYQAMAIPFWIDIRIPPLWILYYQHTVRVTESKCRTFTFPIGYGTHYFTPPRWFLKLIDTYAHLRYGKP